MGVAVDAAAAAHLAEETVVAQVGVGVVDPGVGAEGDGMTEDVGARVLLAAGHDQRAAAASGAAAEAVLRRDVDVAGQAHLQEVGDVQVLGRHPAREQAVEPSVWTGEMEVIVGAVPARGRQVDPALELDLDPAPVAGPDGQCLSGDSVLDSLEDPQTVLPGRQAEPCRGGDVELRGTGERIVDGSRQRPDHLDLGTPQPEPVVVGKPAAVAGHRQGVFGDPGSAGTVDQLDPGRSPAGGRCVVDRQLDDAFAGAAAAGERQQPGGGRPLQPAAGRDHGSAARIRSSTPSSSGSSPAGTSRGVSWRHLRSPAKTRAKIGSASSSRPTPVIVTACQ